MLCVLLCVVPHAVAAPATDATVTLVDGDTLNLFLGAGHDVAVGDSGSVWNTTVDGGFSRREEAARFEVTAVSAASCKARVTARAFGAVVAVGMEAVLGEPLAAARPSAETQLLMVARGDQLYAAGEYEAAAAVYDRASLIDPRANDVGAKQILAVLRGALARGDRGPVFEASQRGLTILRGMSLSPALAREIAAVDALLSAPATPVVTPPPAPRPEPTVVVAPTAASPATAPRPTPSPRAPAATGPAEGDIVEVGPGVELPVLIRQVPLDFPLRARGQTRVGEVRVSALIGVDGRVEEVRVVEVSHPELGFEEAAEVSLSRWRFRPARTGNVMVRVWLPLRLQFRQ